MNPTIQCGKHLALDANLAGSRFENVNLTGAQFENVCLSDADFENVSLVRATLQDINLSDIIVMDAQMGGAKFKHIKPPPDKDGKQDRQRPVTFEEMMLCDSTFRKVDLSNVRVLECNTTGMTIDGILVADMLAAYRERNG